MAEAIVIEHLAGARAGQRQRFELGTTVRFGRNPASEVAFDPHRDLDASANHAELVPEGTSHVLIDRGSSNGTWVDGARIERLAVGRNRTVEVGFGEAGPRLRLFIGDPALLAAVPATIHRRAPTPSPAQVAEPRRSVAMMVQAAAEAARGKRGLERSTMFMREMVDQALHRSTRAFKTVVGVAVILGLGLIAFLVVWNVRLSRRPAAAAPAAPVGEAGPRIVRENRPALWLLASRDESGAERPFCTGFAVTHHHLVTNAHCAVEINRLRGLGHTVFAVQNGDASARGQIVAVSRHPDFKEGGGMSVDVALVEIDHELPRQVRLASRAELEKLEPGMSIYTYGFPGPLARPSAPEATLTAGTIGRLTRLDETHGTFADSLLVQHSAYAGEGTSGSPVFDTSGRVIAVNTGAYVGERSEALSGYNVAIRIDAATALMLHLGVKP
jgi:S1-C subfamily serine protease